MIAAPAAATRSAPFDGGAAGAGLAAISALVLAGYFLLSDLRLAAVAAGALALGAWGIFACARPQLAISLSLSLLLLAGTKFRQRDPDETLMGAVDLQILFELGMFAALGVGVFAVAARTRFERRPSSAELLIAAYVGMALLSTVWSTAPALTLVRATQAAMVGGLAILAARRLTPAGALWVTLRTLIWFVFVAALMATIVPWTVLEYTDENVYRFRWFAVHPLEVALLTGTATVALLGVLLCRRTPGVPHAGLLMRALWIGFVVVLVLTNTRTPLLALFAGVGTLVLMRTRVRLRAAAVLVVAAAAITCVVYASDLRGWLLALDRRESTVTRTLLRTQTVDEMLELNGRVSLWDDLTPIVVAHAAVGAGYQGSRALVLDVRDWAAYAHNALIQTVLDLGVVGLVCVLGLLVLGFRTGTVATNPMWARVTAPALVVFTLLCALSNENFAAAPDVELLLVFLYGLCGAAGRTDPRALS